VPKILIETFECACCRFAEAIVRSSIRGHEDGIECRSYTFPRDREVFQKYGVPTAATDNAAAPGPVVIVSNAAGEQIRIEKINQRNIQLVLERLLANQA
jgi:hypothetical protein